MRQATACARLTRDDAQYALERVNVLAARTEAGLPVDAFLKAQVRTSLARALSHFNIFDWSSYPETAEEMAAYVARRAAGIVESDAPPDADEIEEILDLIIPPEFQALSPQSKGA